MTTHDRPFGRYLEDFVPGDIYKHWPGKTITEADDHLFCMITMNHHPLHTNAWFAENETVQGKNVVVGNLVYSLVLGMSVPDVSGSCIANLEVETLSHKKPTFHGDTIYAETRVLASRRVQVQAGPRPRHCRDEGVQPARRGGLLLPSQADGLEARQRPAASTPLRRYRLGIGRPAFVQAQLIEWGDANRRSLPWRETRDPWAILVSEVMLQQTQVSRVIPAWHAFLQRFPTAASCARAPQADVVTAWAGLGFNRRAVALHRAAGELLERHGGTVPSDLVALRSLPGIGEYTARAVLAFAFELDAAVIDTNAARVLARTGGRRLARRAGAGAG